MRTPLNAALSAVQILQEGIGTSLLEAEYLNVASTSMLATAAALDNITLKGESMQFAVSSGEQDMGSILNDLVVHFTDRVEKGNITMEVIKPDQVAARVSITRTIRQALCTLLTITLKAVPCGCHVIIKALSIEGIAGIEAHFSLKVLLFHRPELDMNN